MHKNIILFDWLSFTSKIDSVNSICILLGLPGGIKFEHTYGFHGYKDRLAYNGINIHFNPFRDDMGVLVEMSGQGCRTFEECSDIDFIQLFRIITSDSDSQSYNITRVDIAYDDFNKTLPVNKLIKDIHKFNFVSKFKSSSIRVEEHAGHQGQTIYFGSCKSATMFRIYDKKFERGYSDDDSIPYWFRFEIQLRGQRAAAFVEHVLTGETIGTIFFGVINNYLRFVKPSITDSNKKRWKTRRYWSKFLEHIEKICLYTPKDTEYNLARCERYVHHQCSNAVECLINSKGVFKFLRDMIHDKPEYTQKYIQVSQNTGEILRFLEKYDHGGVVCV